jgi:hypothetical protein
MARDTLVRFECDCCDKQEDTTSKTSMPTGWMQFAARQTGPVESSNSLMVDLCSECSLGFQDCIYGRDGAHRVREARK